MKDKENDTLTCSYTSLDFLYVDNVKKYII